MKWDCTEESMAAVGGRRPFLYRTVYRGDWDCLAVPPLPQTSHISVSTQRPVFLVRVRKPVSASHCIVRHWLPLERSYLVLGLYTREGRLDWRASHSTVEG